MKRGGQDGEGYDLDPDNRTEWRRMLGFLFGSIKESRSLVISMFSLMITQHFRDQEENTIIVTF